MLYLHSDHKIIHAAQRRIQGQLNLMLCRSSDPVIILNMQQKGFVKGKMSGLKESVFYHVANHHGSIPCAAPISSLKYFADKSSIDMLCQRTNVYEVIIKSILLNNAPEHRIRYDMQAPFII